MIGYKLFRMKRGELYPLYVRANEATPVGVWLPAKEKEMTQNGKVKSRLGELAYRPGWHLSEIPLAIHIGIKEDGKIRYMHDDHVWCRCEFSDEINYQDEADAQSCHYLKKIPVDGYYRYKTNPNMLSSWYIAGSMKVLDVLSDREVATICRANGYEPLPRRTKKGVA